MVIAEDFLCWSSSSTLLSSSSLRLWDIACFLLIFLKLFLLLTTKCNKIQSLEKKNCTHPRFIKFYLFTMLWKCCYLYINCTCLRLTICIQRFFFNCCCKIVSFIYKNVFNFNTHGLNWFCISLTQCVCGIYSFGYKLRTFFCVFLFKIINFFLIWNYSSMR